MSAPPFATAAAAATFVGENVPDTKFASAGGDADFVTAALEKLAEDSPCVEAVDIGDGTTKAWILPGAAAAAFERWNLGFSEFHAVEVERLVAAAPVWDPSTLEVDADFRLENRSGALGVPALYLVFAAAPHATDKVRVRFRRRYSTFAELPAHLHRALAYKACELKCTKLASAYASTVDLAVNSDVFQADPTSSRYSARAKDWGAMYRTILGVDGRGRFTAGPAAPRAGRVWRG